MLLAHRFLTVNFVVDIAYGWIDPRILMPMAAPRKPWRNGARRSGRRGAAIAKLPRRSAIGAAIILVTAMAATAG